MTLQQNYCFIDGTSLLHEIILYNRTHNSNKKLNLAGFINEFKNGANNYLHHGSIRRWTFYFSPQDTRIGKYLILPDKKNYPGFDIEIKECGDKLKSSQNFNKWIAENSPPQYVVDRINKVEKGVDITIAIDIMLLAVLGKLDRALLYTNDSDFVPLFDALKKIGCNISLIRLLEEGVNKDLFNKADSFTYVDKEKLNGIFTD